MLPRFACRRRRGRRPEPPAGSAGRSGRAVRRAVPGPSRGDRRDPGAGGPRGPLLSRRLRLGRRRLPGRRRLLRPVGLPDHRDPPRRVAADGHDRAARLLPAAGPAAPAGALPAPARRRRLRRDRHPGRARPAARRRAGGPDLRHELVPDREPAVVLPGARPTVAPPAPVVAGDRGAVLPRLAARPARPGPPDQRPDRAAVRPRRRRRRRVDGLDVDPLPALRGPVPGLLRHRYPGGEPADRLGPRDRLAGDHPAGDGRHGRAPGRRRGRVRGPRRPGLPRRQRRSRRATSSTRAASRSWRSSPPP